MKPVLQFSVPCLEVKEEDKPPTFAYLFYELPLPSLPIKCPPFYINNGWSSGQGTFNQEIKILSPNKQEVIVETGAQQFTLETQYVPQLIVNQFDQVLFKDTGFHWVQIFLDGILTLEYPITIRQTEKKQEGQNKNIPKKEQPKQSIKPSSLNAPLFQDL